MTVAKTSILVADRNQMILDALEAMFLELDGGAIVTTASSLADALVIATRERPDLVLLDAWIGRLDAVSAVRRVLDCSPTSMLFVMTSRPEPDLESRLISAGAAGCCDKERIPEAASQQLAMVRARG